MLKLVKQSLKGVQLNSFNAITLKFNKLQLKLDTLGKFPDITFDVTF